MNIQSTLKGQDAVQEIPGLFSSMMGDEEILEEEETRNIFLELHDSNYLSVSDPFHIGGREEIRMRRDLVAQEVLKTFSGNALLSRAKFEEDSPFGECLIWLQSNFEFAAWEGRTLAEFRDRYRINGEPSKMNVLQYSCREYRSTGLHADFISLDELLRAEPMADGGWSLPSGLKLWLFKTAT